MSTFNITVSHAGRKFRVKGSASPYIPARTNCSNDDATPAEGGIEDITEVSLLDAKDEKVELPDFLQEYLDQCVIDENFFDDEIDEALRECAESAREDHADRED